MAGDPVLNFGSYRLDVGNEQLWRETQLVRLTPKAWQVLRLLVERSGQLVTKDEFAQTVWTGTVVSDAALTSCIQELRQALEDNARTPRYIETVHRRGFRFVGKVVSDQLSVVSQQGRSANKEEVGSVMPAQPVPSPYLGAGIQESQAEASANQKAKSENGLASSVQGLESENQISIPPPIQIPDGQLSVPVSLARQLWSRSRAILLSLLLLVGGSIAVHYLSLSRPSPRPLAPNTQPGLPLPDTPSIVVLPFVNLSGDPTQEYFSDGVTEEITATLSRVAGLFVIARTSAFSYKGKAVKVQDISREMGVRYVLEGSVQKADGQVRIIAQLIDATTGKHLWSERYDRPLQNIFAVQDEIRQQITLALQVRLTPEEPGRVQSPSITNLDAYDVYLRGREAFWRALYKNDPMTPARQLFEQAIALDPQYAEAYAYIGGTYLFDWFFDPGRNQGQSLKRAVDMGQRAITLNETLPLPHAILATVYVWNKQHEQALVEARRAVTLDPNFAEGYFHLGTVLYFDGQPMERSLTALRKAGLN